MRTQISGKEIDQDEGLFLFYVSIRDRGFIYWRLLSTDPAAAKDVVLAEKPLIAEETDLLEPTLLDELICHIASLASVYHKPPSAFVEGKVGLKRMLPARGADTDSDTEVAGATIIPEPGSLIGDLLDMDLHPRDTEASEAAPAPDLLGGDFFQLPQFECKVKVVYLGGLGELLTGGPPASASQNTNSLLGDIFGMGGSAHTGYVPAKQVTFPFYAPCM